MKKGDRVIYDYPGFGWQPATILRVWFRCLYLEVTSSRDNERVLVPINSPSVRDVQDSGPICSLDDDE